MQLDRPTHKKLERPKQGYPDRLGKPTQLERPRKPARLRNNIHNYDSHLLEIVDFIDDDDNYDDPEATEQPSNSDKRNSSNTELDFEYTQDVD